MVHDPFEFQGTIIEGRYRVDAAVGEGGFGVVYRGFHLAFEHPVAIKCLKVPPHFTREATQLFLDKFRQEGKLLSRLSLEHPSIVRVFDFGEAPRAQGGAIPFLVLEWLEGRSLEEILADRRARGLGGFSEAEAIGLMRPALDALAVAHATGIAHRDIKPANLFVPSRGAIKVLDFGIAKAMQEGETATQLATRTSSGFSAFSPQHGAPEQFRAKKFGPTGPWTDVHALGLVLIELVTGTPAFAGEETGDFFEASTGEKRPSPRTAGIQVSDGFEGWIARCVALEPASRFPNAGEMARAIEAFAPASTTTASQGMPVAAPPVVATSFHVEPLAVRPPMGMTPIQFGSATVPTPGKSKVGLILGLLGAGAVLLVGLVVALAIVKPWTLIGARSVPADPSPGVATTTAPPPPAATSAVVAAASVTVADGPASTATGTAAPTTSRARETSSAASGRAAKESTTAARALEERDVRRVVPPFYSAAGEFKGQYVIEGIDAVRIVHPSERSYQAHVRYRFKCVLDECCCGATGVDQRIFTLEPSGTSWRVTGMGGNMSASF